MPYLEVLNGPEVGEKVSIEYDTFFVGREPTNHLILSERTVSRKHAVINNVNSEYIISDLKSLKGILINGNKTQEVALKHADEITLGAVRLRFFFGQVPTTVGPATNRSKTRMALWGLIVIGVGLGGFFGYRYFSQPTTPQEAPQNAQNTQIAKEYRLGVQLFNGADVPGAKRAFKKVLELDPQKETVFGQKASKLLENMPQE